MKPVPVGLQYSYENSLMFILGAGTGRHAAGRNSIRSMIGNPPIVPAGPN